MWVRKKSISALMLYALVVISIAEGLNDSAVVSPSNKVVIETDTLANLIINNIVTILLIVIPAAIAYIIRLEIRLNNLEHSLSGLEKKISGKIDNSGGEAFRLSSELRLNNIEHKLDILKPMETIILQQGIEQVEEAFRKKKK